MTKRIIAITFLLSIAAVSPHYLNMSDQVLQVSAKETSEEEAMNIHFPWHTINAAFDFSDQMVQNNSDRIFEDETNIEKENINSGDIHSIKLDSILAAITIEPSPDADIHLAYPKNAKFNIKHTVSEDVLTVTADVDMPGNDDVLKVSIPTKTVNGLEIVGGASSVHFIGQEGFLETVNIDVALASVLLENIYADTTVKTGTGTIRMKNESVRSNIRLTTNNGVVDVSLNELPSDVSVYAKGTIIRNNFLSTRNSISQNEKYVLRLENKVGGIHLRKAD
jgi:hypothetical protein